MHYISNVLQNYLTNDVTFPAVCHRFSVFIICHDGAASLQVYNTIVITNDRQLVFHRLYSVNIISLISGIFRRENWSLMTNNFVELVNSSCRYLIHLKARIVYIVLLLV